MTELVIAVSFAILISAGCSLFEAVLYSVPQRHIEAMVEAGKPAGMIFKKMRQNVERPIAGILALNTIANTAGAAFAGAAATAVFGHEWLGYFSAAFTLAILMFSEIIPKTAGVVYRQIPGPFRHIPPEGACGSYVPDHMGEYPYDTPDFPGKDRRDHNRRRDPNHGPSKPAERGDYFVSGFGN